MDGTAATIEGYFVSTGFNPNGNDKYYRKINIDNIEIRIYSGSRTNLLIVISITRNQRAGLIPHLLTSGLIPILLTSIS
jgi:hypothetical protein